MDFSDALGIDVSSLFGPPSAERDSVDVRVLRAMTTIGIMTITGLPVDIRIDAVARHQMLRLFGAPRTVIEGLAGNTRDPSRTLAYHGWFRPHPGRLSRY